MHLYYWVNLTYPSRPLLVESWDVLIKNQFHKYLPQTIMTIDYVIHLSFSKSSTHTSCTLASNLCSKKYRQQKEWFATSDLRWGFTKNKGVSRILDQHYGFPLCYNMSYDAMYDILRRNLLRMVRQYIRLF